MTHGFAEAPQASGRQAGGAETRGVAALGRNADAVVARAELEFMFGKLVAKNPALVGGKLPDEGFYAEATEQ